MEELGRLSLDGVADELEHPAPDKEGEGQRPEAGDEQRDEEERKGERDQWNAERVTEAVERMLVAPRVEPDPLVPRLSAEQGASTGSSYEAARSAAAGRPRQSGGAGATTLATKLPTMVTTTTPVTNRRT